MNIIVSSKKWDQKCAVKIGRELDEEIIFLNDASQINYENINKYSPKYVFFLHWSEYIPAEVYENFECIVFHMTDLPFGRGGSPLQNLIVRGIYETQLSAIRCTGELDSGAVYLKRALSLYGNAEGIYLRSTEIAKEMIIELIKSSVKVQEQHGEITVFKRRKPQDGNIGE